MNRNEVIEQITTQRTEEHCFIKSWGTGHKFADFDLIDRFIRKEGESGQIEGFELLGLEQMWQILIDLDPDKLTRVTRDDGEVIEWLWDTRDGSQKKRVFPFSPEGIMTIIDEEFFA